MNISTKQKATIVDEANKILYGHGYAIINTLPSGMHGVLLGCVDIDTGDLYEDPAKFPLELAIAVNEANTMEIILNGSDVISCDYKESDIEEQYEYQVFGWAEELETIWGLASRSANISLKQIRMAITSAYESGGSAVLQVIRNTRMNPTLDNINVRSVEVFMSACEQLKDEGFEVANLVVSKPIPRTKQTTTLSYAVSPTKYCNMKVRGEV